MLKCVVTTSTGEVGGKFVIRGNVKNMCLAPPRVFNGHNRLINGYFDHAESNTNKPGWHYNKYYKYDKHGFPGADSGSYMYYGLHRFLSFCITNRNMTKKVSERYSVYLDDRYDSPHLTVSDWDAKVRMKLEEQRKEKEAGRKCTMFSPHWTDRETKRLSQFKHSTMGLARKSFKFLNREILKNPPKHMYTSDNPPPKALKINPALDLEIVNPVAYEEFGGLDYCEPYEENKWARTTLGEKAYVVCCFVLFCVCMCVMDINI